MTLKKLRQVFKDNAIPEDVEILTESYRSNEIHEIVYIPSENRVYVCDYSEVLVDDIISSYIGTGLRIPDHLIIRVL